MGASDETPRALARRSFTVGVIAPDSARARVFAA